MPHATFAASGAALLLDVSAKSLPVFALAGLASLALRRASAAARHALWLLALAGLLCLPVFCALLPHWAAPVLPAPPPAPLAVPRLTPPAAPMSASQTPQVAPVPTAAMTPDATAGPAMTEAAPPAVPPAPPVHPAPPARRLAVAEGVCLAWVVGVLLALGRTLTGLAAAGRLVRRCRVVTAGPLRAATEDARRTLGLTRPLSVRLGPVAVPMTCGVRRPVVLLPAGAAAWPEGRLRAVLLHEAAHVQRLDWATLVFARCACALYWPHPLAWLVAHRLRAEAEGACDDLVLTRGAVPAPDYAAHLLEIVRGLSPRRMPTATTVAMASRPEVSSRLRTILDARRPRGGVTRRGLAVAALAALGAVAATAAVHPVARKAFAAVPTVGAARTTLLPGGARVELVGVDSYSPVTKRTAELTPDGTARTGGLHPGWQFLRGAFASLPQSEGVKGSYDYFIVQADTTVPYDVGGTQIVPRGGGRGDVSITAATGNYGKLLAAPLGGTARRILPGGGTLTLSVNANVPRADGTGRHYAVTRVTVTAPAGYLSAPGCVLLPSLASGHPAGVPADRFDFGADHDTPQRLTCDFRTSALQAKHVRGFQFLWRPIHTLTFHDVALRPASTSAAITSGAAAVVQTVSYVTAVQSYDAQGRPQPSGESSSVRTWLRREPPAVAKVNEATGWKYLDDTRGSFTRTAQGEYVVRRLSPTQDGRMFVGGELDADLRDCTDTLKQDPSIGGMPWNTATPWRERQVILDGRPARLFSHEEHLDIRFMPGNKLRRVASSFVQKWVDIGTGRLLRAVSNTVHFYRAKETRVVTESDFQYNQPPPPGVFDWSPLPGARVTDPREKPARVRPAAQMKPDAQARFLAGLTAVQGPGVVVTLDDSRKPLSKRLRALPPGMEPPNLIHDTDINQVVNELKAAGAEAIAVNGERLVAVSPIRSAGPTIFVNSMALTPPYVIRAIGGPARLQTVLDLPGGAAAQIQAFDSAMLRVQASPRITLPAYRGSTPDRYARPVAAQEDRLIPPPRFPLPRRPLAGDPVAAKKAFAAAARHHTNLFLRYYLKAAQSVQSDDLAVGMPDGGIRIIRHGRTRAGRGTRQPAGVKTQTFQANREAGQGNSRSPKPAPATPKGAAPVQSAGAKVRSFLVRYQVPQHGVHHFRILIHDARGTHTAFDHLYQGRASLNVPVAAHGGRVGLRLYDNGRLIRTQTF